MKKLFALMTAFVCLSLCMPTASADEPEGVFVPTFNTFMSSLHPALQAIDSDFADAFTEEYYIDSKWTAPQYATIYYYDRQWNKIEFEIEEKSGFIYSVKMTMPINKMDDWETLYKDIMVAIVTSLVPNADADYEQALFECLYYDYVVDSPVSSVSMSYNFGVYRFTFEKYSDKLHYRVYLGIY